MIIRSRLIIEYSFSNSADLDNPKSVEEVINGPEAKESKKAMEIGMETIGKVRKWISEDLPKDSRLIGSTETL